MGFLLCTHAHMCVHVFAYPHLTVVMCHNVMGLPPGRSDCVWEDTRGICATLALTIVYDYNGTFASCRHMECLSCL